MIKKNNIKFIDLDLPSKILWGDRNFGNNKYYSWGELKGYSKSQIESELKIFDEEHYKFYDNIFNNNLFKYGEFDNLTELQSEDDVVTQTLGKNYRIPRKKDFEELIENTDKIYTDSFVIFKSKVNGNQIKFSFSGYAYGIVFGIDLFCCIWSSSLGNDPFCSWILYIDRYKKSITISDEFRCRGSIIRPICFK